MSVRPARSLNSLRQREVSTYACCSAGVGGSPPDWKRWNTRTGTYRGGGSSSVPSFEQHTREPKIAELAVAQQQPNEWISLDVDPTKRTPFLCENSRASAAPGVVAVPITY